MMARLGRDVNGPLDEKDHSSLAPYGLYLLLMIALMLFVREIYFLATTGQLTQYKEQLFYPFAAGTELAAVLFFLLPGIVPLKRELVEATRVSVYSSGFTPTNRRCCSEHYQMPI